MVSPMCWLDDSIILYNMHPERNSLYRYCIEDMVGTGLFYWTIARKSGPMISSVSKS